MAKIDEAIKIVEQDESKESVHEALAGIAVLSEKGFTPAMEFLALVFSRDDKWYYDAEKAEHYWIKAIGLGDVESMYDLAMFYFIRKKGKTPDYSSGLYWMQKAAKVGHPLATIFMKYMVKS